MPSSPEHLPVDIVTWGAVFLAPIVTIILRYLETEWALTHRWVLPIALFITIPSCYAYLFSYHLAVGVYPNDIEFFQSGMSAVISALAATGLYSYSNSLWTGRGTDEMKKSPPDTKDSTK